MIKDLEPLNGTIITKVTAEKFEDMDTVFDNLMFALIQELSHIGEVILVYYGDEIWKIFKDDQYILAQISGQTLKFSLKSLDWIKLIKNCNNMISLPKQSSSRTIQSPKCPIQGWKKSLLRAGVFNVFYGQFTSLTSCQPPGEHDTFMRLDAEILAQITQFKSDVIKNPDYEKQRNILKFCHSRTIYFL